MRLKRDFFAREVTTVAKDLLGYRFVHQTEQGRVVGKIVETEAYGDAADLASHARFGETKRSKIMFGPAGILYVYKIYGIFNLTNIICGQEGGASAVLIRSAEITEGTEIAESNLTKSRFVKSNNKPAAGPGKFSLALGVTTDDNGTDLITSNNIWLEAKSTKPFAIIETTRIGVDYAKESKEWQWRYYIADNKFVSKY